MCDTTMGARPQSGRPRWAALYAVTLLPLSGLGIVGAAGPQHALRALACCFLAALASFAGMAWWLRANRAALDLQEWCECASRTITTRVIESRRPALVTPPESPVPVRLEERDTVHV
jgi:hypothetical protein